MNDERPKPSVITLTSDFGLSDGYVASMKGVLLGLCPGAELVDISHEVPPHEILPTALILEATVPYFPPETVHLVVVDPGVGSSRRPVALRTPSGTFVGPDNGVFSYVMAREPVEALVELADPRYRLPQVSHTFHGRDIFAPAAAYLASGVPIGALGPRVSNPVAFPSPRLEISPAGVIGEVLHADHFGNVITSIGLLTWSDDDLLLEPAFGEAGGDRRVQFRAGGAAVVVAGQEIAGVRRTYADVATGEALALVGSEGHLEVAVREGSAAHSLGLRPGDAVVLQLR